ncbi:MAG: cytochrome C oxidase subunit IV family protein [Acidimicrobiales bacterium]
MSTTTEDVEYSNVSHDPDHREHPSDAQYVKVAAFLAVLTGLEVSTYFWEDIFGKKASTTALVLTLFPMMIIKFGTVILYFMHLKYDNPLFKRVFLFGLILAVIVFAVMMTTFNYWWDDYFRFLTGH